MRKFFNFKNKNGWPIEITNLALELEITLPNTHGSTSEGMFIARPLTNSWSFIPLIKTNNDVELYIRFRSISIPTISYNNNEHGLYMFRKRNANSGYHLSKGTNITTDYTNLLKFNRTDDGSMAEGTQDASNNYKTTKDDRSRNVLHFRMSFTKSNTTFRCKHWLNDEVEPTTWGITKVDATYINEPEHQCHGLLFQGYGNWCLLEAASYATDGDSAPTSALINKTFYGTIRDEYGNPLPNMWLGIYDKFHGGLIDKTKSTSEGNFDFTIDIAESENFFIAAIDYDKKPVVIDIKSVDFANNIT